MTPSYSSNITHNTTGIFGAEKQYLQWKPHLDWIKLR